MLSLMLAKKFVSIARKANKTANSKRINTSQNEWLSVFDLISNDSSLGEPVMQNISERLQESRETIAYQQLALESESSLHNSVNSCSTYSNKSSDFGEFKMNDSKYSKVIFSEISESYPTDADIECRFYIGDAVVPSDLDKIGLFRVGWNKADECLIIKSIAECETDNEFGEKKLKFNASELPKHGEEFYQFCYLNSSDEICGASTPFRFLRPHEEDLIQLDNRTGNSEEDDFVVVRSQQALLQERLEQLVNQNGVLEYSKRSLEQQIVSMTTELNELRKVKVEAEDRIKLSQMELSRVMNKLKDSEEKNSSDSEQIENLEIQMAEIKKIRDDYEKQLEDSQSEFIKVSEDLKRFENNKSTIEQQLECRVQEIVKLTEKNIEQQLLIEELTSSKAFAEAELELSRTSIAKVMSERRDLDVENKMLRNELEDIKAKCDTLEGNKDIMMNEILDLEKIKLRSKVELKTMKEDMEDMNAKLEQTEATQKTMSDEWKVREEAMHQQLNEMKLRLSHASEEYQKLYKHNIKLENRIDRIKSKVKNYFDAKSQSKNATNVSPKEQQELISAAETEVKTVIECEVVADSSTNDTNNDKLESITIITLPCSLCREEITCTARDMKPMTQHLEEKHSQRLCPICSMLFDATVPGHQNYFQMHVENHFDVPNYPPPSAPTVMYP